MFAAKPRFRSRRLIVSLWFNRGSTKNASGELPVLVTLTLYVCVVPVEIVTSALGRLLVTFTWSNWTVPVNGSLSSRPETGLSQSTTSDHWPARGSPRTGSPSASVYPGAELSVVMFDE